MRVSYKVLAIVCLLLLVPAAIAESPSAPYRYTGRLSFDIAKVPFSRYGSYMAISEFTPGYLSHLGNANLQPGVYLRSVHGDQHAVFRMELLEGNSSIAFHAEASPSVLKLQSARGDVEICIPKPDELRFRGQRVSLRLTAVEDPLAVPNRDEHWEINSGRPIEKYMLWATQGHLHMDAPWNGTTTTHVISTFEPDASTGHVEGVIDTYPSVWKAHTVQYGFQTARKQVEQNYDRWLARMPDVPISLGAGAELAAYVNWTSVVEPDGFYARPAMLMSKNWMAAVWSWDHCFNAMASSFKDPEFAWQQFMLPFDVQQQDGSLPDMIKTSSKEMNFTKPPIHGWVLAWMMQHGGYQDNAHLAQIYEPLARWTDWYFQYRDTNANGLPEYNHGNDSGWDNSTAMLTGVPVETPDLDSFLVLQMDTLAKIAGKLGKDAERRKWQSRSDELLHRMLDTLWRRIISCSFVHRTAHGESPTACCSICRSSWVNAFLTMCA